MSRSFIRAGLPAAPLFFLLAVLAFAGCASRVAAPKVPAKSSVPPPPDEAVFRIGVTDSAIIASVAPGLARSVDHGADWSLAYPVGANDDIETIGSTVLAANANGLLFSKDNGRNWLWTPPESGLPAAKEVTRLAVDSDGTVYAIGDFGGVYRSTDQGSHWQSVSTGLPTGKILDIAADGGVLFAQDGLQLYRSTNRGDLWATAPVQVMALTGGGGLFFMYRSGVGLFFSGDNGDSWIGMPTLSPDINVFRFVVRAAHLFAITSDGLWLAADDLASWSKLPVGTPQTPQVEDLAVKNGALYAATRTLGIQRSDDGGATWVRLGPTGGTPPVIAMRSTAPRSFAMRSGVVDGVRRFALRSFASPRSE